MRPARPTALRIVLGIFLIAAAAFPAAAVTDEEVFRNFRFNFDNPGARALAMGGAFIAIANDATAAQANPARLGVLRLPEIFAEIRSRDPEPSSRETGQFFIDPSANPAASLSLNSSVEPESQTTPSVVSFVWPFRMKNALTVGISRQELLSVESSTTNNFALTPVGASPFQDPNNPEEVLNSAYGTIEGKLVLYNLSAGYQLTKDLFVGGSVIYGDLSVDAQNVSTFADPDALTGLGGIDPRFETPQGRPIIQTEIDDGDTDITWSIGLFWKISDYVSLGTVYKKGVRMTVQESVDQTPLGGKSVIDTSFNVPDISGFGIAYRPWARSANTHLQNILFATDIVRTEYEDLLEGFVPQLNVLTLPQFVDEVEFEADNQTAVRLGAEYYMPLGRSTLAFRAGFYTDPDSSIHLKSAGNDTNIGGFVDAIEKGEAFPASSDETHLTAGLGYAIGGVEFALAFDRSDVENQSLFSVIYRFKR